MKTRENKTEAEKIIDQLKNVDDVNVKKQLQERFWSCVNETPLISKNEDGTYKVTFVYQFDDKAEIKLDCLDLRELLVDNDQNEKLLKQIPETNIYYIEIDNLPSNTIIPYEFEVNGGRSEQDHKNPKSFNAPMYDTGNNETKLNLSRTTSILALPESKPQLWSQNYIAENKGSISKTIIMEDEEFGKRPIWVYTPPGFNIHKEQPYQLMLVLDGHTYIDKLPPALDTMCENNENLANTVVAIIGNVDPHSVPKRNINPNERSQFEANRKYEYIDHSKEFSVFITNKILPILQHDTDLNVSDKSENTYLVGFSLGGHFTAEVGLNYSDKIGNLICLSGAFNNRNAEIIDLYKKANLNNLNVYLSIGTFEDRVPNVQAQKEEGLANMSRQDANKKMFTALTRKVKSVKLDEFPVGHSEMATLQCIGSGISFIQNTKLKSQKEVEKVNVSSQSIFSSTATQESSTKSDKQTDDKIWVYRKKGG